MIVVYLQQADLCSTSQAIQEHNSIRLTNKYLEPQCWRLSINIMLEIASVFLNQSAFGE